MTSCAQAWPVTGRVGSVVRVRLRVTRAWAGAGKLRPRWILLREKASWDDWAPGRSGAVIVPRRSVEPGSPRSALGQEREGLTWHVAKGPRRLGCACRHARPIRRVVLTSDRERGAFARNATVRAEGYAGPVF